MSGLWVVSLVVLVLVGVGVMFLERERRRLDSAVNPERDSDWWWRTQLRQTPGYLGRHRTS